MGLTISSGCAEVVGMKMFLLFFILATALVSADFTDADRQNLLTLTQPVITERVDDFDQRTSIKYSGEPDWLGDGVKIVAIASWKNKAVNPARFLVLFTRVDKGWQWLKSNGVKVLVDDELMEIEQRELQSDVMEGGKVFEAKPISLSLEQMLCWVAAEKVRVRIGLDEYSLGEKEKLPLLSVLGNWIGRGGDISSYQALAKLIFRPSEGMAFDDVVKKYGAPVWRDTETGWATWDHFWARFKTGKVVETRARREKDKAAH